MATIDLRTTSLGHVTSPSIRAHCFNKARFDASEVSGNLVSGNTYNYLELPAMFLLIRAMIRVVSADGAAGTSTLTDGSITPLAAQVMNATGVFIGTTSLPKYYPTGGTISGLIATANITTAIFDVIAEGIDLRE